MERGSKGVHSKGNKQIAQRGRGFEQLGHALIYSMIRNRFGREFTFSEKAVCVEARMLKPLAIISFPTVSGELQNLQVATTCVLMAAVEELGTLLTSK